MMVTDERAAALRVALERELLTVPDGRTSAGMLLTKLAKKECIDELSQAERNAHERVLAEHWGALARAGVIVLVGDVNFGGGAWLTLMGRRILESREPSPHDESGFAAAIRSRAAAPDAIVMAYVVEAASAWRAALYRASAVMMGCACERLVLMLAEKLATVKAVAPFDQKLEKALSHPGIATIFDLVRRALALATLPNSVGDGMDRRLTAIFEHSRSLRNKAGHPTGNDVSLMDAHATLLLFPGFYAHVDAILNAL